MDQTDIRGLGTAGQWDRRELASVSKPGSGYYLPAELLEDSPFFVGNLLYRFDYAQPSHSLIYFLQSHRYAVFPVIAPQINPDSSRATAVAATWDGLPENTMRTNFLFNLRPAR